MLNYRFIAFSNSFIEHHTDTKHLYNGCSSIYQNDTFSDNLGNSFEPISNLNYIEIKNNSDYAIASWNTNGWEIYIADSKTIIASLTTNNFLTSFSLFFDNQEQNNLAYQLFFIKDPFNRYFYSRINLSKAADFANEYMYLHDEIDFTTFSYNKDLISHNFYQLSSSTKEYPFDFKPSKSSFFENPNRGTVYTYNGSLFIESYDNYYHMLPNVYLELWAYNSYTNSWNYISNCYTNDYGSFSLYMPVQMPQYTYIAAYAFTLDFFGNRFVDSTNNLYWTQLFYCPTIQYSFYSQPFYIEYSNSHCQEFWSLMCIDYCSRYAAYLNNSQFFDPIHLVYENINGAAYNYSEKKIAISANEIGTIDGKKITENWDILGHEYGHHVQNSCGFQTYYPYSWSSNVHIAGYNDCDVIYEREQANNVPLLACRFEGLYMAWRESWPTFFGNCAQNHFSTQLANVPTCCNNQYEFEGGYSYSYETVETTSHACTDSCEDEIISFLYNLNDTNNDTTYDLLSLSDTYIFDLCCSQLPMTFNDFYLELINDCIDSDSLSRLLTKEGLVPSTNEINFYFNNSICNISTSYLDRHTYYDYEYVEFEFYSINKTLFMTIVGDSTNSVSLTNNQISLLNSYSSPNFYLRIKICYPTLDLNDYYLSPYYLINKASGYVSL